MEIQLFHDLISALISFVLSIILAYILYLIDCKKAFFQDVVYPILNEKSSDEVLKCIEERKKLYCYSKWFPNSKKIRKAIDAFECSARECISKEEIFNNAIMDYYFIKIGEERYVKYYDDTKGDYQIKDKAPNINLSVYASRYSYGINYPQDALSGLIAELDMYCFPEGGSIPTNYWFNDITVNKVVEDSPYFKKYSKANDEFDCARIALEKFAHK